MKQTIRQNIFETNSSSVHSLVIFKHSVDITNTDLEELIPIMESSETYADDPVDILSYIYTIALLSHDWNLIDTMKQKFPKCIFQRPQWDLPFESDTNYCDDLDIISFCDLLGTDLVCHYDKKQRQAIADKLFDFVFNGELFISYDAGYDECILKHHVSTQDEVTQWFNENVSYILEE